MNPMWAPRWVRWLARVPGARGFLALMMDVYVAERKRAYAEGVHMGLLEEPREVTARRIRRGDYQVEALDYAARCGWTPRLRGPRIRRLRA